MRFKPMDEFPEDFQSFEPSLPLLEMDSSMGLVLENPSFNLQSLMDFSDDGFFLQQPDLPISLSSHNLSSFSISDLSNSELHPQFVAALGDRNQESEMMESSKRKSEMSPTLVSEIRPQEGEKISRKNSSGRRKRGRCHEKQVEKPEEVIHVRARRGQATDSHSVAERARREKINERLRKLQDLVPGCYKMMGMTAMLDEIIRYVQSLQNQIEFLSMKLSAADSFHNFCTETEAIEIRATDEFKGQMWSGW